MRAEAARVGSHGPVATSRTSSHCPLRVVGSHQMVLYGAELSPGLGSPKAQKSHAWAFIQPRVVP